MVKNAVKFTSEGSIEFGYEKKGEFLEFFVKDTGVGICREQTEIIFERFRQGSESLTRNYEGSGLGLSISKAYVEMLGGKIWIKSKTGKGSTFYFTIPYNAASLVKTDDEKVPDASIEDADQIKKLKILIAEDNEMSETLIRIYLEVCAKEIIIAKNGVDAVKACRNNADIDLVLMDIQMPEMDGYEATRQIRQFNSNVIIVAQTAFVLNGDRENALDAGCNDYISKPFNQTILTGVLKKYFRA
jgi:hypothetical protein